MTPPPLADCGHPADIVEGQVVPGMCLTCELDDDDRYRRQQDA